MLNYRFKCIILEIWLRHGKGSIEFVILEAEHDTSVPRLVSAYEE